MLRVPVTLVAALVCASASAGAHDPPRTRVTWNGDIARLVAARCVRCHAPDGKGPMPLAGYDEARPWAKAIREEVLARRMPKWHAARGFGQFQNDPSLSPFEISLFVSWVDGGALRGTQPIDLAGAGPAEFPDPGAPLRHVTLPCRGRLPKGRLVALTPQLQEGASAGFTVVMPGGRREILAWIRNYEADFQETYRLRSPLVLPAGSRLEAEPATRCSVRLDLQP